MRGASGDTQSCSAARPCQRGWEGRLQGADGTRRVLCDCSARTGNGLYGRLAPYLPRSVSQTRLAPPRPAWLSPVSPPGRLAPSPRPASLRPRGPPCSVPAGPPRSARPLASPLPRTAQVPAKAPANRSCACTARPAPPSAPATTRTLTPLPAPPPPTPAAAAHAAPSRAPAPQPTCRPKRPPTAPAPRASSSFHAATADAAAPRHPAVRCQGARRPGGWSEAGRPRGRPRMV
jgi:hypothetical protein